MENTIMRGMGNSGDHFAFYPSRVGDYRKTLLLYCAPTRDILRVAVWTFFFYAEIRIQSSKTTPNCMACLCAVLKPRSLRYKISPKPFRNVFSKSVFLYLKRILHFLSNPRVYCWNRLRCSLSSDLSLPKRSPYRNSHSSGAKRHHSCCLKSPTNPGGSRRQC